MGFSKKSDRESSATEARRNTHMNVRPPSEEISDILITDGFLVPHLDVPDEAPPAYGNDSDELQLSGNGIEAGAAVTDAGRISINVNSKHRRLASLLNPTFVPDLVSSCPPPAYTPPSLVGTPGQKPPPKLNVVIQIVGSRGDVQPFVALGKTLKSTYGHRIRVATHPVFQKFVEENGLEFFSIGGDPAELMAFMVKNPGLTPGFEAIKSGEISRRRKGVSESLVGCWRSCFEAGNGFGPPPPPQKNRPLDLSEGFLEDVNGQEPFVADAIIANPPSFAHLHIAEKLGIPLHMMFTMPWTPTRSFPHPLVDIKFASADEAIAKYLSYTLVEMLTWQGLGDVINRFRVKVLDLQPLSMWWAPGLLSRLKVPYTYCWSPALIPRPNDWGRHIDVSGFYFLDLATSYAPEPELASFLEAGPPPIYIGFGSIVVDGPNALTQMIFEAVRRLGVRALVSKGWGGLGGENLDVPEGVFMLGNVPHDWLFQHVSCVVHHGGAGTTAAGIKAGRPTFIVPFFGDQPFWGDMIARAKAGPEPIRFKKLTAENLAEAIKFCLTPETVEQARLYGEKIREERGTDVGSRSFHNNLDMETLRCSLAPSRAAVWRVRRSGLRLSALAAATLVAEGFLAYSDLKLYRPRTYNTESQPTEPISAATSAFVSDMTTIGLAIADLPLGAFKSRPKSPEEQKGSQTPKSTASGTKSTRTSQPGSPKQDDVSDLTKSPVASMEQPNESSTTLSDLQSANASSLAATSASGNAQNRTHSQTESTGSAIRGAADRRSSSPSQIGLNAAIGAGRSLGTIVSTGVKSPMNVCLGLAKGFRNAPMLYGDDTVRPVEKVTDIASGFRVATKELTFGIYDGVSGLVTQPWRGAEKEGMAGFVKGVGKGIGGAFIKPSAAVCSVPAYTMQGFHAAMTRTFSSSCENYIITSRISQGQRDLRESCADERHKIVEQWGRRAPELSSFFNMKKREKFLKMCSMKQEHSQLESRNDGSKQNWLSFMKKGSQSPETGSLVSLGGIASAASSSSNLRPSTADDAEYEQAIKASVAETSRGNAEEDAMIEAAIRESVRSMRLNIREQQTTSAPRVVAEKGDHGQDQNIFQDNDYKITDKEYQDLIEQAVQQSLAGHAPLAPTAHTAGFAELDATEVSFPSRYQHAEDGRVDGDDDAEFNRVLEASKSQTLGALNAMTNDDEFERAIAASREEAERMKSQQTEEDIVLEYIKKQSAAEEEYRKKLQLERAKGKSLDSGGQGQDDYEDDQEQLMRAIEESLKMGDNSESGPSRQE